MHSPKTISEQYVDAIAIAVAESSNIPIMIFAERTKSTCLWAWVTREIIIFLKGIIETSSELGLLSVDKSSRKGRRDFSVWPSARRDFDFSAPSLWESRQHIMPRMMTKTQQISKIHHQRRLLMRNNLHLHNS